MRSEMFRSLRRELSATRIDINLRPGVDTAPREPIRFEIKTRGVPLYLRTMNATGDKEWVAATLAREKGGKAPDAAALDNAFDAWISRAESDLLLVMDCDNRYLLIDLWDRIV